MAQKFEISPEEFDQLCEEQQPEFQEILKWEDLEVNAIYKITDTKNIETSNGESCIIILSGGEQVWAPSVLTKKLETQKPPLLVRPKGKRKSKNGYNYYDLDLVKPKV